MVLKMKRIRPKVSRQLKTVYCVVIEGKTEQWYLELMKKYEKPPRIHIKPELPKQNGLNEIKEFLIKLLKQGYDKIFWLIDLDVFITNCKIDRLKDTINSLEKKDKFNKLKILINNPCLEFWYLLHFRETGKCYSNCKEVVKAIKKIDKLSDYEKSKKYYLNNPDIYQRLKSYQKKAIVRAKQLDKQNQEDMEGASAQIYKLLQFL